MGWGALASLNAGITSFANRSSCSKATFSGTPTERLTEMRSSSGYFFSMRRIIGGAVTDTVHNHHNYAWRETHEGRDVWVVRKGVTLVGADLDESPMAYRRLPEVIAQHAGTIKVLHTLRPLAVAMAGGGEVGS